MKKTLLILMGCLFVFSAIAKESDSTTSANIRATDTEVTIVKVQLAEENTYTDATVTPDDDSWLSELFLDVKTGIITGYASVNTGAERTANLALTLKSADGTEVKYEGKITITQAAADVAFEIDSEISETIPGDESSSTELTSTATLKNADVYASYSVSNLSDDSIFENGTDDITFDPAGGKITLENITENTSGEERTATFTLTITGVTENTISKSFSISQDATSQGNDGASISNDE